MMARGMPESELRATEQGEARIRLNAAESGRRPAWRARSASDKTDDWPLWYVTDDMPADRNKTVDAVESATGMRPTGLPFLRREDAEHLAAIMNEAAQ